MTLLLINKFKPSVIHIVKNNLFNKSINFVKINSLSKKIIGKDVLYFQNKTLTSEVMEENINVLNHEQYFNGEKIFLSENLPIGAIQGGIVIFDGEKENYGKTVIIQGTDGFNIWYGNLNNINVEIYTYVEKNSLIANANGDFIYLTIEKDGKYYNYEEYKNSKN